MLLYDVLAPPVQLPWTIASSPRLFSLSARHAHACLASLPFKKHIIALNQLPASIFPPSIHLTKLPPIPIHSSALFLPLRCTYMPLERESLSPVCPRASRSLRLFAQARVSLPHSTVLIAGRLGRQRGLAPYGRCSDGSFLAATSRAWARSWPLGRHT